jgi:hypothetical protein
MEENIVEPIVTQLVNRFPPFMQLGYIGPCSKPDTLCNILKYEWLLISDLIADLENHPIVGCPRLFIRKLIYA